MNIQLIKPSELHNYGICGYKNVKKQEELQNKINWYEERYKEGLRIRQLITEEGNSQGMIEYVPGEFCWRPVAAKNYMFIHCLFSGYKKAFKGQGFASEMIKLCIEDARDQNMHGVAVVSRKTSFMAGEEIFLKNGFVPVDEKKPDFKLLVYKFDPEHPDPYFLHPDNEMPDEYRKGLIILRADQCPYSLKNVKGIVDKARKDFGISAHVIDLKSYKDAQKSPCAFGTFCIIYNGKIISYHPISETRFGNIMKKLDG